VFKTAMLNVCRKVALNYLSIKISAIYRFFYSRELEPNQDISHLLAFPDSARTAS
jgi:hypothetical protein